MCGYIDLVYEVIPSRRSLNVFRRKIFLFDIGTLIEELRILVSNPSSMDKKERAGMTTQRTITMLQEASTQINELAGMTLIQWHQCDTCHELRPMPPHTRLVRCLDCRDTVKRTRRRRIRSLHVQEP